MGVCAIFRNEAPYLREWIEFHRIAGIERFYLYQNNSGDDWRQALEPYVENGVVEVIDWRVPSPTQVPAYHHFARAHAGRAKWVAFIDCDEFLFSPVAATVTEVLEQAPFSGFGAIAVNWMCFGGSGHEQCSDGLVTERFTWRLVDNFGTNAFYKSIVRMDRLESAGLNAHLFNVRGGTFNQRGQPVTNTYSFPPAHEPLRINHYVTKSREEFVRRIAHGRVDQRCTRDPREFDVYQAQDVEDRTIWRFLPELKRRLAATEGRRRL